MRGALSPTRSLSNLSSSTTTTKHRRTRLSRRRSKPGNTPSPGHEPLLHKLRVWYIEATARQEKVEKDSDVDAVRRALEEELSRLQHEIRQLRQNIQHLEGQAVKLKRETINEELKLINMQRNVAVVLEREASVSVRQQAATDILHSLNDQIRENEVASQALSVQIAEKQVAVVATEDQLNRLKSDLPNDNNEALKIKEETAQVTTAKDKLQKEIKKKDDEPEDNKKAFAAMDETRSSMLEAWYEKRGERASVEKALARDKENLQRVKSKVADAEARLAEVKAHRAKACEQRAGQGIQ